MKLFAGRLDARREERGGERSQEGDRGVNKTQAAGPPGKVHFHFGNLECRILKHGVQGVEGGLVHSAWRPGHSHSSLGFPRSARHPLSCIQASQRAREGGTGPELPCSHMGHRGWFREAGQAPGVTQLSCGGASYTPQMSCSKATLLTL